MSVLLDEETVVLVALDFEPSCDCNTSRGTCGEEETHRLVCTACGGGSGLSCIEHSIYVRTNKRRVTHVPCGTSSPMRELVEVVPL